MIAIQPNRSTLIAYLTCGDPDLATSREVALAAIDAGASVLELGVPFSDPVADGPVVQRASERALRNNVSLHDVLQLAAELRGARPQAGLIAFSYLNPILQFGLEKFAIAAKTIGLDGALITDLTVEEADVYLKVMRVAELATIFLAAPTSTDARLRRIAKASAGFIYAVSRTGVTGAQAKLAGDAALLVKRLRRVTKLPIAVGFGISTPEQFRAATEFADAAVVGSAIVKIIEESSPERAPQAVAEFIRNLKSAAPESDQRRKKRAASRV
jgi:tryptophan synthase alpha chain